MCTQRSMANVWEQTIGTSEECVWGWGVSWVWYRFCVTACISHYWAHSWHHTCPYDAAECVGSLDEFTTEALQMFPWCKFYFFLYLHYEGSLHLNCWRSIFNSFSPLRLIGKDWIVMDASESVRYVRCSANTLYPLLFPSAYSTTMSYGLYNRWPFHWPH